MPALPEMKNAEAVKRRLELVAVVLIAFSTVLSAWCVYESARWNGHQSFELSRANGLRSESVRSTEITATFGLYDTSMFLSWVNAVSLNRTEEAAFLKQRFRDEFRPAFDAWLAKAGPDTPIPPGTPFGLPEYQVRQDLNSTRLKEEADAAVMIAQHDAQIADDYVLNTVLFTIVLFLEGISNRWKTVKVQKGMVVLACGIFVVGILFMLSLPVSFAF